MNSLIEKITHFFDVAEPLDLVMVAILVLVPLMVIVILIAALVKRIRRKSSDEEVYETYEEPVEQEEPAPVQAVEPVEPHKEVPVAKAPERVKVKVCVKNLSKADKYTLAATGIFCIGLGAMIQRALSGDRK